MHWWVTWWNCLHFRRRYPLSWWISVVLSTLRVFNNFWIGDVFWLIQRERGGERESTKSTYWLSLVLSKGTLYYLNSQPLVCFSKKAGLCASFTFTWLHSNQWRKQYLFLNSFWSPNIFWDLLMSQLNVSAFKLCFSTPSTFFLHL